MTGSTDKLLPQVISLLKAMEPVFRSYGVDYYLVGALARDVHLSARVIGRKIGLMLKDYAKTGERVRAILSSRPVPAWLAMLDGMNES